MKIRSGKEILDPEIQAPKIIADRMREKARIVKRLLALIATHAESATRMGVPLGLPDLLAVISALEAEADGLNPVTHLTTGEDISSYLRASLYEELNGEPSNIFYTTQVNEKVIRYEALPKDFWKECLARLRVDLAALKKK